MFNHSNQKKSFYAILDLSSRASIDEIKESYARAKSTYSEENPALYGMVSGNERAETLSLIEEAFKVLSNPDLKNEYDCFLSQTPSSSPKQVETSRPDEFKLREDISIQPQNNLNRPQSQDSSFEKKSIKKLIETNKYQLNYDVDETFEKNIRDSTSFDGEFLQQIREYKKVTIEKMADMTRVSKGNIKNIEAENAKLLPALVYVRGFVYQYAKCLKLNPELVASSYMHQLKKKLNNI